MTPSRDNFEAFDTIMLLEPAAITATTTSSPVDLDNYNSCTVLWTVGTDALLKTGSKWTLTLTESDVVGSGYTTVVLADIIDGEKTPTASIVVEATTEDGTSYKLGYKGNKRFLKAVLTETGTLNGVNGLHAIVGNKRMGPYIQAGQDIAS